MLKVLLISIPITFSQVFQPMPVMYLPIQYPIYGNLFDNGLDLEYSPITQLVSSVAHMMEMHQVDNSRRMRYEEQTHPQLTMEYRSRPEISPKFNLIPYSRTNQFPPQSLVPMSTSSKVVNSLPSRNLPSVMYKIGDLISTNKNDKENIYDTRKIKGFPILKTDESEEMPEETHSKQIKVFDLAKRFLGLDEIPTADEGNAILQLLQQQQKHD